MKKENPRDLHRWSFDWYERAGHEVRLNFSKGAVRCCVKMNLKSFKEMIDTARNSENWTIRQAVEVSNVLGKANE